MRRPKQFFREWLGIQHLSDYIALTRKELGLSEGISVEFDKPKMNLANRNIYKGRDHSSQDDLWPETKPIDIGKIKKGYGKH